MRVRRKIPFAIRNVALAAALATVCTQAGAVLVADGKLGDAAVASPHGTAAAAAAEGYTHGWTIGFSDDKGNLIGNGELWFGTDGAGNQFLYFMMPLDYVDNTYGTNSDPSWVATTGKAHTFDNLLGSDSMGANPNFEWTDANAADPTDVNAARIDYIANCYDGKTGSVTDPANCGAGNTSGYKSAGVGDTGTGVVAGTNGAGAKWDKIDADLTGSAASILEIATSLEYNLKNIDPTAIVNSSLDPNWLKEVGYEIQFAPGTFDPTQFGTPGSLKVVNGDVTIPGLLTLGDPHVSPPKQDFGSYRPPCLIGDTNCVPEPGTTWLLGAGLAGMLWYARRRRDDRPASLKGLSPS